MPLQVHRTANLPSLNFLTYLTPSYQASRHLRGAFLEHYPVVRLLSVFTVLEVLWLLLALVWNSTVYLYLRLFSEVGAVGQEVWVDLKSFGGVVLVVFAAPFRLLLPERVAVTVVRHEFRWPAVSQLAFFVVMALVITLPLKGIATWATVSAREGTVLELATKAVGNLRAGGQQLESGNATLAELDFKRASETFNQALGTLGTLPNQALTILNSLPGTPQRLVAANHLLAASQAIAQAAATAAHTWSELSAKRAVTDFGTQVALFQAGFSELKPQLDQAIAELSQVEPGSLPPNLGGAVASLQNELNHVEALISQAFSLPGFLQQALASTTPKRYVVLFQNSSELRPTGGFLGSLALVELQNGVVKQVQIPGGGPYDFQGSLKQVIRPPEPLRLVRGTWQLQDANWFYDFPTSAQKVLWFLKASGGPDAQGVVALTPDVVLKLLELTGPIDLPQYHKTLTAENFMRETQLAVEVEYDRTSNRPKQFIADLAPVLLQRIINLKPEARLGLLSVVEEAIRQRSLQVYFTEPELEANARSYGWAGEVKQAPLDYLAVVRTNIGGGKTDAVTDEVVRQEVEIQPSGELISQLTLTRTHSGSKADLFEQRRNTDFIRFYVPAGSTLLSADGFTPPPPENVLPVSQAAQLDSDLLAVEQEPSTDAASGLRVTNEFGKAVFGGWLAVAPGETRTIHLSYQLPFSLKSESSLQDLRRYSVYFQRQAGVKPVDFTSTLKLPTGWRVRWQESSSELTPVEQGLEFKADWMQDEYYGVVLERTAR